LFGTSTPIADLPGRDDPDVRRRERVRDVVRERQNLVHLRAGLHLDLVERDGRSAMGRGHVRRHAEGPERELEGLHRVLLVPLGADRLRGRAKELDRRELVPPSPRGGPDELGNRDRLRFLLELGLNQVDHEWEIRLGRETATALRPLLRLILIDLIGLFGVACGEQVTDPASDGREGGAGEDQQTEERDPRADQTRPEG
jgi:hypothetical protein